jgi:hypothetical protein
MGLSVSPKCIIYVFLFVIFLGGGLFADEFDLIDTSLDGDQINGIINRYVTNISNLAPDSTTVQNVWSSPPGDFIFGVGLNASMTFASKKETSRIDRGGKGFGGGDIDLAQFPEGLEYLPALAIDIRGGLNWFDKTNILDRFDIGIAGMIVNSQWLPILQALMGEDADFTYGTVGIDARVAIIDGKGRLLIGNLGEGVSSYIPAVVFQAGYYFTFMESKFNTVNSEEVKVNFRTDSYAFSLQASKTFEILEITPYFGLKYIISATDTAFSWTTGRPVRVKGGEYPDGATYHSGDERRDPKSYFQIYGGAGITLSTYNFTMGFSYNAVTEHFGINAALRFLL